MNTLNQDNLRGNYELRVKQKKDYAKATNEYSKKLETEEQQMLNRLQKTYQTERAMSDMLN